jgi:NCS1 family nucleobase:cation symporter-1
MEVGIVWRRFFQISFFFGYAVSASLYFLLNKLSPPPGLGVQVDFDVDGTAIVIDGVLTDDEKHVDYSKQMQMGDTETKSSD